MSGDQISSVRGASEDMTGVCKCHAGGFSDVPGPIKNLRVVDTADGEVSLAWEEPESDGGSKIIAYVVERRDVKRKTWTLATDRADTPEYCVSGLQKDSLYLFRVCARNRVGSGPTVATEDAVQAKNKFGKRHSKISTHIHVQSPHSGPDHILSMLVYCHQMFQMLLKTLQWSQ